MAEPRLYEIAHCNCHNQGLKARPHALNRFGPSFQGEASPVPVCRAANLLDQSLEAGAVLIAD